MARQRHWPDLQRASREQCPRRLDRGRWCRIRGGLRLVGQGRVSYVKFDDYTTFTTAPFGVGNISPREVKLEDYIWRAGMNYKFW
jgi:hypothetical protein